MNSFFFSRDIKNLIMSVSELSEFIMPVPKDVTPAVSAVVPDVRPTKKRKKSSGGADPELAEMRKRAQSYCKCFEQWNSVRRYSKKRLGDWLEEKEYEVHSNMQNSVFDFVQNAYAFVLDLVTKGDGHVLDQIKNDLTLRQALEDEGRDLLKYLSNKSKVLFLSGADVYHGKQQQRLERKEKEVEVLSVPEGSEGVQEAAGAVPGNPEGEAAVYDLGGEEEFGEDVSPGQTIDGEESVAGEVRQDSHNQSNVRITEGVDTAEAGGGDGVSELQLDDHQPDND
jgi:hypothetical protein